MAPLKAVVKDGRLVLDAPTDLPDGTEVELAVVEDAESETELLDDLEASETDEAAGRLVDFEEVISKLGSKPYQVAKRLASPEGQARLQAMAATIRFRAQTIRDQAAVGPTFLVKRVTI